MAASACREYALSVQGYGRQNAGPQGTRNAQSIRGDINSDAAALAQFSGTLGNIGNALLTPTDLPQQGFAPPSSQSRDHNTQQTKGRVDSALEAKAAAASATNTNNSAPGSKKRRRDPNAPKGPTGRWIYFMIDYRPIVKSELGDAATNEEIVKRLMALWKELSHDEQVKYEKLAEESKKRYMTQLEEYKRTGHFSEVAETDKIPGISAGGAHKSSSKVSGSGSAANAQASASGANSATNTATSLGPMDPGASLGITGGSDVIPQPPSSASLVGSASQLDPHQLSQAATTTTKKHKKHKEK